MSEPMTLKEAVEWQTSGRSAFWSKDPERFQSMSEAERSAAFSEWSCKNTDADELIFANAKRTVEARRGEPSSVALLRSLTTSAMPLTDAARSAYCDIAEYIDHLTTRLATAEAERDAAREDLAEVREMIGFAEESPDEHIVRVAATINQQHGWMQQEINELTADRDRLATAEAERDAAREEARRWEQEGIATAEALRWPFDDEDDKPLRERAAVRWQELVSAEADRDRLAACAERSRIEHMRAARFVAEAIEAHRTARWWQDADMQEALKRHGYLVSTPVVEPCGSMACECEYGDVCERLTVAADDIFAALQGK